MQSGLARVTCLEQTGDGLGVLERVVGVGEVGDLLLDGAAAVLVGEHAADAEGRGRAVAGQRAAPRQTLQLIVAKTCADVSSLHRSKAREDFSITEKAPTRNFSWLKAPIRGPFPSLRTFV